MTIDRGRVITTLVELCGLRSPSGEEHPVREYVRAAVAELGLAVTEDARGNLYARTSGPDRWEPLFLCSHMDTVPVPSDAEVTVVRENGRISSDGATILGGDDKQGIAALEAVLQRHADRGGAVILASHQDLGLSGVQQLRLGG